MLRERTDRAFYDIRPGNGANLFFQPRSLNGPEGGVYVWVCGRVFASMINDNPDQNDLKLGSGSSQSVEAC